ncbi:MAG: hypothetical protein HDR88_08000 [Bacteroides sp.]|nr:hypothetical protein [Bacteroides sp.]
MNTLLRPLMLATAILILGTVTASAEATSVDGKFMTLQPAHKPITLTAQDLVTKAYGVVNADMGQREVVEAITDMHLNPSNEDSRLWIDSADGYVLSYNGMTPEVSAYATFDNETVSGYSFFFMFPYESDAHKVVANYNQCEFCSTLLQELNDMGIDLKANDSSDSLFNAAGSYGDSNLNIALIEDGIADNAGRFIVILEVEPNAFTPADELPAIDNMMAEAF